MKRAIYPGTFDPMTNGHLDIIKRAIHITDHLVVAVARDISPKKAKDIMFSFDERIAIAKEAVHNMCQTEGIDENKINIIGFDGLLIKYIKDNQIDFIIRGLRAFSDFDFELNISGLNSIMHPIETVFLFTSSNMRYISSSSVKEIYKLGGDISKMVPQCVVKKMEEKS